VHYVVRAPTGHVTKSALGGLAATCQENRARIRVWTCTRYVGVFLIDAQSKADEYWDKLMW